MFRKTFTLILCLNCFICLSVFSQDKDTKIWDSPYGEDRFIVNFHLDGWMNIPDSVETRPFSLGVDAHVMFDYTFGESNLSWAWGYGFSSHNVHHNGYFQESLEEESSAILRAHQPDYNYSKNKHSANYMEIPLELRFRTKGINKFKLYAGFKTGYLVNFHSKIIDDEGKRKFYNFDYINKWRYGLTGKIGYKSFCFSGFYSLTPLLKESDSEDIIPFSMGITYFLL